MTRRRPFALALLAAPALLAAGIAVPVLGTAPAASAAAGDRLVVSQVGTAGSALVAGPSPVSIVTLDSASGATTVPEVALPVADDDAQHAFTLSGTSDAQGGLALSSSRNGLSIGGFGTVPSVTAKDPKGTTAAAAPRIAAWIGADGTVDTSTVVTGAYDQDNIRSVASVDGSALYATGNDAATAIYSVPRGTGTTTAITTKSKNLRTVGIFGGQMYASSDKLSPIGIGTVGTGVPTSTATVTPIIDSSAAGSGTTPNAFTMLDRDGDGTVDTAYLVVEKTGLFKYARTGTGWVAEGSVPGTFLGVTAQTSGSTAVLYTLAGTGERNSLVRLVDTAASAAPLTADATSTIATAPAGTAWRGVAFAPTGWDPKAGGSTPTDPAPVITASQDGLPLSLGDTTNPSLTVTAAGDAGHATELSIDAGSAPVVATPSLSADGTLTATPLAVGISQVTVTATDTVTGATSTRRLAIGVSAATPGLRNVRAHDGMADGSTAIDVGDGYFLLANDEDSVIRLYTTAASGFPLKSWDMSSHFAAGDELDLEASARVGDTVIWSGSMSNTKKSVYQASRNVLFSTEISGSGAGTELAFGASYAGLRQELIAWDSTRAAPLGLATACSTTAPTFPDDTTGCNLEGLEFAPGSSTTAYLGLRSPRVHGDAVIVPVTDYASLPGAASGSATFGDAILLDLGGRTIRELRATVGGQYLITAGAPDDDADLGWALYRWNGVAGSAPVLLTALPASTGAADGQETGSYESIVTAPAELTAGSVVRLLTDNGTTAFYGDGVEGKDIAPQALQRSLSMDVVLPDAAAPASLSAGDVAPGSSIRVAAAGFTPGETVHVVLHSDPIYAGTLTAGPDGAVSGAVVVPASASSGVHTLVLTGGRSGVAASAALSITAVLDPGTGSGGSGSAGSGAASPAAAGDPSALATTGADPSGLLLGALVLLIAGAVLLGLRRRPAAR